MIVMTNGAVPAVNQTAAVIMLSSLLSTPIHCGPYICIYTYTYTYTYIYIYIYIYIYVYVYMYIYIYYY